MKAIAIFYYPGRNIQFIENIITFIENMSQFRVVCYGYMANLLLSRNSYN